MASSLTIGGVIVAIKSKADQAGDAGANASYREINLQFPGALVSFVATNATEASGIDALFVGSTCTATITSP